MAGDALDRPGPVRELLERASRAIGVNLAAVIERGTPQLTRTEVSQPALTAVGVGLALEALARGLAPSAAAGHSVGELSALCIAGCLTPEEAIDVVVDRARFMAHAARAHPGGMAAVREPVDGLELAAHNAPNEWVVTGDRASLAALKVSAVPLPVAGPWHSRFMAGAADPWRASLAKVRWRTPRIAVVANGTGAVVNDRDDLVELLVAQLTRPVRWAESLQRLKQLGVTRWHFFGPARVLRGLCRANGIDPGPHEARA
jgi:[acyl-carrier-protein] S-malonyltransferase